MRLQLLEKTWKVAGQIEFGRSRLRLDRAREADREKKCYGYSKVIIHGGSQRLDVSIYYANTQYYDVGVLQFVIQPGLGSLRRSQYF
jgi:hypothetical protein